MRYCIRKFSIEQFGYVIEDNSYKKLLTNNTFYYEREIEDIQFSKTKREAIGRLKIFNPKAKAERTKHNGGRFDRQYFSDE